MPSPKKHATNSHLWLVFVLSLLIASCGMDQPPESPTGFYCNEDGFCAQAVGSKSLTGGYRSGDREIRFEVAYRPYLSIKPNVGKWCVRLLDWHGASFAGSDNSNVPPTWITDEAREHQILSQEELIERNGLLREMFDNQKNFIVPKKRSRAWAQVLRILSQISDDLPPGGTPIRHAATDALKNSFEKAETFNQEFILSPQQLAAEPSNYEDVEEEASSQNNTNPNNSLSVSTQTVKRDGFITSSPVNPLALLHLVKKKGKVFPARLFIAEEYEFHQTLELHSQPVKNLLVLGFKTRKHHSGAVIKVYRRKRDSRDPWSLYKEKATGNHGTEAGQGSMRAYAFCDAELPITKGYFAWLGECDGKWGSHHLCNDDTAYQIWHAYGNWREGKHCYGKRRDHRPTPWCGEPWPSRRYGETAPSIMPALPTFTPLF